MSSGCASGCVLLCNPHIPSITGDFFSSFYQELDDVIRLSCELEEKKIDGKNMEVTTGTRVSRTYKYADLKDLQSRLTLVAGEKQKENKDIIQKFDAVS